MLEINDIKKFLKESIEILTTADYTCRKFTLDADVSLYVGWSEGFDPDDGYAIHSKENPTWGLVAGIKFRDEILWADFDALVSPTAYNPASDDYYIICEDITLQRYTDEDEYGALWRDALYFIENYGEIREVLDKEY